MCAYVKNTPNTLHNRLGMIWGVGGGRGRVRAFCIRCARARRGGLKRATKTCIVRQNNSAERLLGLSRLEIVYIRINIARLVFRYTRCALREHASTQMRRFIYTFGGSRDLNCAARITTQFAPPTLSPQSFAAPLPPTSAYKTCDVCYVRAVFLVLSTP